MALMQTKRTELPKDAVLLSEQDALKYQFRIIDKWDPESDIWPIKYGSGILGVCGVISGAYINQYYRTKLRLMSYGRITSYLPIVALPAIMTSLYHKMTIQSTILLQKEKCPVCIQTRAGLTQSALAVIFPCCLAPLSSFMFATRHFTYRLPSIIDDPKAIFKLWKKLTIPIQYTIFGLLAVNFLVAGFITYKEIESYYTVQIKLREFESQIEN